MPTIAPSHIAIAQYYAELARKMAFQALVPELPLANGRQSVQRLPYQGS